ncbi:hypothetical protein T484DRAFT_1902481 [Baffinella frigidus]|nr:hypothetical protein T484DRAFT_1902481 [Cryptophyta sp. CCMP2293]
MASFRMYEDPALAAVARPAMHRSGGTRAMGDITNRGAAGEDASSQPWSKQMAEKLMSKKSTSQPSAQATHKPAPAQAVAGNVRRQLVGELDSVHAPAGDSEESTGGAQWLDTIFPADAASHPSAQASSHPSRVPESPRSADAGPKLEVSSSLRSSLPTEDTARSPEVWDAAAPSRDVTLRGRTRPLPPAPTHVEHMEHQEEPHMSEARVEAASGGGGGEAPPEGQGDETWWECDFCSRAFENLEEANQHEDRCLANPASRQNGRGAREAFLPGSDIRGLTPGRLLSPIHEASLPSPSPSSAPAPSPAPSPYNATDAGQSASQHRAPAGTQQRGGSAERPPSGSRAAPTHELAGSASRSPQEHPGAGGAAPSATAAGGVAGAQAFGMAGVGAAPARGGPEGDQIAGGAGAFASQHARNLAAADDPSRAAAVSLNGAPAPYQPRLSGAASPRSAAVEAGGGQGGVELSIPPVQLFTQSQVCVPAGCEGSGFGALARRFRV